MYSGGAGGMETAVKMNLTREEFETIARDLPRPLVIPLCMPLEGNFPAPEECSFILESLDPFPCTIRCLIVDIPTF